MFLGAQSALLGTLIIINYSLIVSLIVLTLKVNDYERFEVVYHVIGGAMEVHKFMGKGLLEPIYQEALSWELEQRGVYNRREVMLSVFYKEHELDKRYKIDMLVEEDIIVETKAVNKLLPEHRAQLCNYLRIANKPIGLLINFGEKSLMGERWAYDKENNECFLVDKHMNCIYDTNYTDLFYE